MELAEGTQNSSAVGLDGNPAPSSTRSITGANILKGVKKKNSSEEILSSSETFQNDIGQTLGFVGPDGSCYIDADNAQVKTLLHEIGIHMLMDAAKQTGEAGLRNAIIEYGKQAPQEFVDHVKNNYSYLWDAMESCRAAVEAEDTAENREKLEDAEAAFYEEVAAHAFGKAFEDRQAEFAQQNIFQRLLQAIKEFIDNLFNGRYANLDVFDSVEKLGEEEIGQKLYDLVMGGREIANSQMNRNAATYTARLEKLRNSAPVSITGDEIQPSEDLSQYRKNALEYGKNLRGKYRNSDTGKYIRLVAGGHGGIKEVLEHDYKDIPHLQSIAAIPQIIEKGIYVDTLPNEHKDKNPGIAEYEYYICGLKIGNEDYTVKAVIGVDVNGDKYYDHKLTNIEKGKLIDELARISTSSQSALSSERTQEDAGGSAPAAGGVESSVSSLSDIKDIRLLSILQNLIDNRIRAAESESSVGSVIKGILGEGRYVSSNSRRNDSGRGTGRLRRQIIGEKGLKPLHCLLYGSALAVTRVDNIHLEISQVLLS